MWRPRTVLGRPLGDPPDTNNKSTWCDVPGLSWDVPWGILRTQMTSLPDGTSRDCPETSLGGSSGHQWQVYLMWCPRTVLGRPLGDPPDTNDKSTWWDVPGLSWDVPWGILRTPMTSLPDGTFQDCPGTSLGGSSGHQWQVYLMGCSRTVMGRPLGDPPETNDKSAWCDVLGLSWDIPWGILQTPMTSLPDGTSQDCPGTSLGGSSGHQWQVYLMGCPRTVLGRPLGDPPDTNYKSAWCDVLGLSWDVPWGILRIPMTSLPDGMS